MWKHPSLKCGHKVRPFIFLFSVRDFKVLEHVVRDNGISHIISFVGEGSSKFHLKFCEFVSRKQTQIIFLDAIFAACCVDALGRAAGSRAEQSGLYESRCHSHFPSTEPTPPAPLNQMSLSLDATRARRC